MFLTHYYDRADRPFQSLSALSDRHALKTISNLQQRNGLVYRRFKNPENYLKFRHETETWLRNEFIDKGGNPASIYPYYFVINRSIWIEEGYNRNFNKLEIPISDFDPQQISFTYPDSIVSYWLKTQIDKDYYQPEYHGQVFLLDEILKLVDRFGIPDREWQTQSHRKYDLFIEAQVWNIDRHLTSILVDRSP
jgi:hypothetical protein